MNGIPDVDSPPGYFFCSQSLCSLHAGNTPPTTAHQLPPFSHAGLLASLQFLPNSAGLDGSLSSFKDFTEALTFLIQQCLDNVILVPRLSLEKGVSIDYQDRTLFSLNKEAFRKSQN